MMKIILLSEGQWHDSIAAMVIRGLTFKAYEEGHTYVIELTGGY